MARATISEPADSHERVITIKIERQFDPSVEQSILREALLSEAKQFAKMWMELSQDKIFARLNVDAIANMVMVEVAKDIKNDIREKS